MINEKRRSGMKALAATAMMVVAFPWSASAQEVGVTHSEPSSGRRHLLGSSLFMLANLAPLGDAAPQFFQLNYGFRLTPQDVLFVEAITWRYHAPLGIPYWAPPDRAGDTYPGFIKEYGIGLSYQRYLWRKFFAQVHATPFLRQYLDEEGKQFQSGFQLFMTLRLGYHFGLFDDRVFVEPSIAATHWPIATNVPEAFARLDRNWPNYFLFEPGLHFGIEL